MYDTSRAHALPVLQDTGATLSTDVVFLSAAALTDPEHTLRDIAARGRAEVVVATAGDQGAYLLADDELTHVRPVTPPAPVIDSNGANACTVPSTRTDAITRDVLLARMADLLNREDPGTRTG